MKTVFLRYEGGQVTGVYQGRHAAEAAASWHFLDDREPAKVRVVEHQVRR